MGTARNVSTSARWSAGRVLSSVTYSFIAQKLNSAKNTSEIRLLTTIAAKNTAAISHQALTRAESSEKSLFGRARRSAATATEAITRTPSTSNPISDIGDRLFIEVGITKSSGELFHAARAQLLKRLR